MLTFTMSSTKAISPSTAICQRPGISSRFIPPNMKSQITPSTIRVHSALLVKTNGFAPWNEPKIGSITNWCIGSILPSAATLSFPIPVRREPWPRTCLQSG
jgi:hypothetical protein